MATRAWWEFPWQTFYLLSMTECPQISQLVMHDTQILKANLPKQTPALMPFNISDYTRAFIDVKCLNVSLVYEHFKDGIISTPQLCSSDMTYNAEKLERLL